MFLQQKAARRSPLIGAGIFIPFVLCSAISGRALADNFLDMTASMHADSNSTRALLDDDQYDDISLDVATSAGRFIPLGPGRSVSLWGTAAVFRFRELKGLDAHTLSLNAAYQHKFGLGAYAPVARLSLGVSRHDSVGKARDRNLVETSFSYSRRFSPAWSIQAGLMLTQSEGTHDGWNAASNSSIAEIYGMDSYALSNDIYDFAQHGVFAGAEYLFANQTTLSLSYTWLDGSTVSSALAPNSLLFPLSRALVVDPAVSGRQGRPQVAYRIATRTRQLAVDWSIPAGRDTSLSAGLSWQDIEARQGIGYRNTRFSVVLMHSL